MATTIKHRGPQPGIKHSSHLKKEDLRNYAAFCLRDDIAEQLHKVIRPHQLAVKLYEKETGIKVPPTTAYKQRGRWALINGELYEIRKVKDFIAPPRPPPQPKTTKRKDLIKLSAKPSLERTVSVPFINVSPCEEEEEQKEVSS